MAQRPTADGIHRATAGLIVALLAPAAACGTDPDAGSTTSPSNAPPIFSSAPPTTADHNRPWEYTVTATDPEGAGVTITITQSPAWIAYDSSRHTLAGTPGLDNVGANAIAIRASDGETDAFQNFVLDVQLGEIDCNRDFGEPAESPYILPYPTGRSYTVQQGNCNTSGGHRNWFAYDFDLAMRDSIVASRAGTVIAVRERFADGTRICGQQQENLVFVEHDDGTVMAYIHLTTNGALVRVGEAVFQGQVIGLSGDSGCSAGPHLHVALFADARTGFDRQFSLPVNYANAQGPLSSQRGLIAGGQYTAVP